ncbi:MAG: BTB/POZ domain-containing protein, partial [Kangiellaceae bacterium]|nr:BTB/POZ domain-containing protein [Kangiellaceae bacterium]
MLDSHMKTFMACLHKMKENDVMTDVTLKLPDGSSVSCHKIVLMASSPFFEVMFESEFKESATQDIPLDFADAVTIKTLVEFFYSGEINVCNDNVQTLVAASEFLCMKDLKNHCDAFMATRVDTSNCIELSRFGKKFNLMRLISAAREFILLNFKDVVKRFSDFPTLTENELIEVVSSDELNADNEDLVFSAVVRWVNHDADERKEAFSRIAPLIRFPFCTHETLNDAVSQEPLMGNSECMELIREALYFNMHNHHYLYSPRTVPRRAFNGKRQRLVRFYGNQYTSTHCEYADCIDGDSVQWKLLHEDSQRISKVIATPSGFIVLQDRSTFFTFIIHREKLIKMPSAIELKFNWEFIFFNGRIYAFNGLRFRASGTEA